MAGVVEAVNTGKAVEVKPLPYHGWITVLQESYPEHSASIMTNELHRRYVWAVGNLLYE